MSKFPCEILDHIVDLLHDSQIPLRNCCLVSKSWVPRTRTHLFAEIHFQTKKSLESWKTTFPDPSTSPACYTKALSIGGPKVVTTVDVEASSWIRGFSRVVRLAMVGQDEPTTGWGAAFTQFRGFSPFIKSLCVHHVAFPPSQLSNLILSFPLLEDLSITDCYRMSIKDAGYFDWLSTAIQPSSLPMFTGSLDLFLRGGMRPIVHRWLSLPDGVHFRKLTLKWTCEEDILLMMALGERCSNTLESLDITNDYVHGTSIGYPIHPHGGNLLFSNHFNVGPVQPCESNKAQRCGFPTRIAGRRMDLPRTPGHHARTSRSPTSLG